MKRLQFIGFLVSILVVFQAQAVTYRLTVFGTLGGSSSGATAINANGQIVGSAWSAEDKAYHAFIGAPDGAITDLGTLGGRFSFALGINARGQVVGGSLLEGDAAALAFVSAPNGGALSALGTLGGGGAGASAINDLGQVVGASNLPGDTRYHAFMSDPEERALRDLGTLGGSLSIAYGINASGQVAGYSGTAPDTVDGPSPDHAFLSAPNGGTLKDLGTLGGAYSRAYAVNDAGRVVGTAMTAGDAAYHAFISGPNGGALHELGPTDVTFSMALAINNLGQVVGQVWGSDQKDWAFVSAPGGGELFDLNRLIDPADPFYGLAAIQVATAINDKGQIAGSAFINGSYRAFVATPIPLPATIWLLGVTLAGIGFLRRRAMPL